MFVADSDPALKARAIDQALRLPEAIGKALFPRIAGWDAGEMDAALDAVRVPLLVIQSTYLNSERVRVAIKPGETTPWIDLVRARVPGAQVELITGVGHFPQLEAADRVNTLLEEFCVRVLRPPGAAATASPNWSGCATSRTAPEPAASKWTCANSTSIRRAWCTAGSRSRSPTPARARRCGRCSSAARAARPSR